MQNLIRIQLGEVFFNRLLGTKITGSLFELATSNYVDPIKSEISTTIENFEPRVKLTDVRFESTPDQNAVDIQIDYDIIGMSAPSQSINFVLEPTRL